MYEGSGDWTLAKARVQTGRSAGPQPFIEELADNDEVAGTRIARRSAMAAEARGRDVLRFDGRSVDTIAGIGLRRSTEFGSRVPAHGDVAPPRCSGGRAVSYFDGTGCRLMRWDPSEAGRPESASLGKLVFAGPA